MRPIRVLLADDHALVRAGLRKLLETLPGVEVIGEAGDGREALRLVNERRPQIALMDVSMPELNGLEAAARIARDHRHTRVLILSMHASEEYALRALRAGAAGYVLKDAAPAELELALRAVGRGEIYLSPAVASHVVGDYRRRAAEHASALDRLTPRQVEVLQLLAEGHTGKSIAQRLGCSVKTVEHHRTEVGRRLGIRDLAGLVRFALRHGLASTEAR